MKTLLLSLIAYLCAFTYECGYCDQFRIPHELIRLDVTRFLVFAAKIVTSLVLLSIQVALLYAAIRGLSSKKRELVLFFKAEVLLIIYGLTLFFLSGFYAPVLLIWIGAAFVYLVFSLLLLIRFKGSMRERISASMQFLEKDPAFYKFFVERFGRSPPIFLLSLIALIASSYFAGLAEARGQRDFLVTTDSLVILRVYGNRAICLPLRPADKSDKSYSLRNLDNIDTPFEWRKFNRVERPFEWLRVGPPLLRTEGVSNSTATPSPTPTGTTTPTSTAPPPATPKPTL